MKYKLMLLTCSCLAISSVNADVGFGVGATYVIGSGLAVGPKLFTTNEEKKVAASAGVDYVISSSSFRPNIGISYLFKEDIFADINVGYNLKSQKSDFGIGVGYTKTENKIGNKTENENTDSKSCDLPSTPYLVINPDGSCYYEP